MNASIKLLIVALVLFLAVFLLIDQLVCNNWIYHDYAAGIDRRVSCYWK